MSDLDIAIAASTDKLLSFGSEYISLASRHGFLIGPTFFVLLASPTRQTIDPIECACDQSGFPILSVLTQRLEQLFSGPGMPLAILLATFGAALNVEQDEAESLAMLCCANVAGTYRQQHRCWVADGPVGDWQQCDEVTSLGILVKGAVELTKAQFIFRRQSEKGRHLWAGKTFGPDDVGGTAPS